MGAASSKHPTASASKGVAAGDGRGHAPAQHSAAAGGSLGAAAGGGGGGNISGSGGGGGCVKAAASGEAPAHGGSPSAGEAAPSLPAPSAPLEPLPYLRIIVAFSNKMGSCFPHKGASRSRLECSCAHRECCLPPRRSFSPRNPPIAPPANLQAVRQTGPSWSSTRSSPPPRCST